MGSVKCLFIYVLGRYWRDSRRSLAAPSARRLGSLILAATWVCGLSAAAQTGGVAPEWDTRTMLADLAAHIQRFKPILAEARPAEWVNNGAPQAYQAQLKSAQNEVDYLTQTAAALSKQPNRLTKALETFLRMQSVEAMLVSLGEGLRRYQNPALADLLQSLVAEAVGHREKLRQHLVDLAAVKEAEFLVADREAQRCRSVLSRQPGAAKSEKKPEQK